MSEARVRLRLAGEATTTATPLDAALAPALPEGTVAVVAASEAAAPAALAFARMLAGGAPLVRASLRTREGASVAREGDDVVVHAGAAALDAALEGALEEARGSGHEGGVRVAVGWPFVARRRAGLAILVTGGASRVGWDPSVRAIAERFDVILPEPREGFARALSDRLARA